MIQGLIIFDISTVIMILVLSYLSRRLGEALKIYPYYKLLDFTALIITAAFFMEVISVCQDIPVTVPFTLSNSLRFTGAVGAFSIALIYWKWLFSEFFKR